MTKQSFSALDANDLASAVGAVCYTISHGPGQAEHNVCSSGTNAYANIGPNGAMRLVTNINALYADHPRPTFPPLGPPNRWAAR